jgi:hypothetical protein
MLNKKIIFKRGPDSVKFRATRIHSIFFLLIFKNIFLTLSYETRLSKHLKKYFHFSRSKCIYIIFNFPCVLHAPSLSLINKIIFSGENKMWILSRSFLHPSVTCSTYLPTFRSVFTCLTVGRKYLQNYTRNSIPTLSVTVSAHRFHIQYRLNAASDRLIHDNVATGDRASCPNFQCRRAQVCESLCVFNILFWKEMSYSKQLTEMCETRPQPHGITKQQHNEYQ